MKKYLWMLSAAVVIGALRVKVYTLVSCETLCLDGLHILSQRGISTTYRVEPEYVLLPGSIAHLN